MDTYSKDLRLLLLAAQTVQRRRGPRRRFSYFLREHQTEAIKRWLKRGRETSGSEAKPIPVLTLEQFAAAPNFGPDVV
jgi:hypothetical protein